MDSLWRKGLTVTHKEGVRNFCCEKHRNMPKWAACFLPFDFSSPPREVGRVSAQRPERL